MTKPLTLSITSQRGADVMVANAPDALRAMRSLGVAASAVFPNCAKSQPVPSPTLYGAVPSDTSTHAVPLAS